MTLYNVNDQYETRSFSSYVVANSVKQALDLLTKRRQNEMLDSKGCKVSKELRSVKNTQELFAANNLDECLHTLCYIGNILIDAGLITKDWLISDVGLLHDILHIKLYPADMSHVYNDVYQRLKKFDKLKNKLGY